MLRLSIVLHDGLARHTWTSVSSTPIWETYAKSGWVNEKTNAFIKKLAEDHPMEVDYSAIKLGYLNLGA